MGFLPEAMRNYLLRLGWSHGDDEIISTEQAIDWFDLDAVGKSPARFDLAKLSNLNGHYIREADDARLVALILPLVAEQGAGGDDAACRARLTAGMAGLKARAKTLVELAESAAFYCRPRPLPLSDKAAALLDGDAPAVLGRGPDAARSGGVDRGGAGGGGARLCGGPGPQARQGRPAVARRADRLQRLARDFRGHGRAGTGGKPCPHRGSRKVALRSVHCQLLFVCLHSSVRRTITAVAAAAQTSAYEGRRTTVGGESMSERSMASEKAQTNETATLTDNQTGETLTFPVLHPTIGPRVIDIRRLYADLGMFTYDPGFTSTASCESAITYIDGEEGVLLHRGYSIEELAEKSDFLEVCYLLLYGELPNKKQKAEFENTITLPHHAARADDVVLPRLPARRPPDGGDGRRGRRACPPSITTAPTSTIRTSAWSPRIG